MEEVAFNAEDPLSKHHGREHDSHEKKYSGDAVQVGIPFHVHALGVSLQYHYRQNKQLSRAQTLRTEQ